MTARAPCIIDAHNDDDFVCHGRRNLRGRWRGESPLPLDFGRYVNPILIKEGPPRGVGEGTLGPPHKFVPTKMFDIPAALLCK